MTDQQNDQQPTDDQGGDGKTVPYTRFKQVNDRYRAALAELEAARQGKGGDGQPEGDSTAGVSQGQDIQAQLAAAQTEVAALKKARLQDKLALETGVPLDLASKIAGDDEAAMRADAEAMARYVAQSRRPVAPNIDGATPTATPPAPITLDTINDPAFYAKNRDAIFEAVRQGRVK